MTYRCPLLLTVCCLIVAPSVHAAPLEQVHPPAVLRIESELDATGTMNLRLSDHVRLTLTVTGATPKLPLQLIESPDWEVQPEPVTADKVDGKVRWQQTFRAMPRKTGSFLLTLRPTSFGETTVEWKPVAVNVTTAVGRTDVKELRDVLPPEAAPPEPPLLSWLAWIGGTVVVGVLLLLGWRVVRRLLVKPRKPLTPTEEALRELDRIESLGLPAAGQSERYHTLVADVVRVYLERRYQLRAPRQTTGEFLRSVQQSPDLTEEQREQLRGFLERCDVVKFAGERATAEACAAVGTLATTFVVDTASSVSTATAKVLGEHSR